MRYIKNATKVIVLFLLISLIATCSGGALTEGTPSDGKPSGGGNGYDNVAYEELNSNQPEFSDDDLTTDSFETYSELDLFGRCGVAYANISRELMPDEERGEIGHVRPSGWHTVKYNDLIEGNYLYNRCHLIAYQLAGENANEKNLITGTRYLNVQGMLPFENMVADYVRESGNHVLYRVTPVYDGNNLVASGVTMEAMSVEDGGEGICFNVFVRNIQPGIVIDYETGESMRDENYVPSAESYDKDFYDKDNYENSNNTEDDENGEYVLNTNTNKFHKPTCSSVYDIADHNRKNSSESRKDIMKDGYSPCKRCNP